MIYSQIYTASATLQLSINKKYIVTPIFNIKSSIFLGILINEIIACQPLKLGRGRRFIADTLTATTKKITKNELDETNTFAVLIIS